MSSQSSWDVIILGAGIAGLSAGMYSGRFGLKTLIIGEMPGGIITTAHLIENYPGVLSIKGVDMGNVFLEHAKKFGAKIKFAKVTDIEKIAAGSDGSASSSAGASSCSSFKVKTTSEEFIGKTLIFATGTKHGKLGVPGEKEFNAKGVSYCALCDAAFFKDKTVCLVGGGDSSAIEALILAEYCKKVYMFVRKDYLRAEPINHKKVMENPKIEVRFKTEIAEIKGKKKVESVVLKSGEEMPLDGVFIAIGNIPVSELASKLGVELDEKDQIKINRDAETNIPGVFAAGDVCDVPFKQAITGAAQGVIASYFANRYLKKSA